MKHSNVSEQVLIWLIFMALMIKFPVVRVFVGLFVVLLLVMRILNFLSKFFMGKGSFQKKISVSHRSEIPAIFNHIVSDEHVKGKVAVTRTSIIACGCEYPMYGEEKLTVAQAQAHMQRLVYEFDDSVSNTVYFTFKTNHGRCTVSYRMIGQQGLEIERANMWTFPPSAKYSTQTEDSILGVLYNGPVSEYSSLMAAA